jgi:hypothetical protein
MNSTLGYSAFGAFVRGWGEVSQLLWGPRDDFESIGGEKIGRRQFYKISNIQHNFIMRRNRCRPVGNAKAMGRTCPVF